MSAHPLAGKPAPKDLLIDVNRIEKAFYETKPDMADPNQLVSFGTSGHRGTSRRHVHRSAHPRNHAGDLRYGRTRGSPARYSWQGHPCPLPPRRAHALEVLAANGVETSSRATTDSRRRPSFRAPSLTTTGSPKGLADGIIVTPSHNPPRDGGFKYNPTHGGPADTDVTDWIQDRANELLRGGNKDVRRITFAAALKAVDNPCGGLHPALRAGSANVLDLEAIRPPE